MRSKSSVKWYQYKYNGLFMNYSSPPRIHLVFLFPLLLLLGLLLSSTLLALDQDILLLEKLGKLAVLVHRDNDVATTDELLVDVELGNGGPVAVLLDTCMMRATVSTCCLS